MLVVLSKEITQSERSILHLFDKWWNAIPLIPIRNVHAVHKYQDQNGERGCSQHYNPGGGNPRRWRFCVDCHALTEKISALHNVRRLFSQDGG